MFKNLPEPAVSRHALVMTSGIVWLMAGLILSLRGFGWIIDNSQIWWLLAIISILIGSLKSYFVFFKVIKKNVRRIRELAPHKDKICIFAFQANMSYLLVILMMSTGHFLRLSPIPRLYLGILYLAIGVALAISGLKYINESHGL